MQFYKIDLLTKFYKVGVSLICLFLFYKCASVKDEKLITTDIELGEKLFFDSILSRDNTISCASCHKSEFAFADSVAFSKGIYNHKGTRNTPSAMNQLSRNFYFWDGRAESLEEQALGPIENPTEMDLPLSIAIKRLLKNESYKAAFINVYGQLPSKELLAKSLTAFENSLETSESPFDKYIKEEDTTMMTESAKRGLSIFNTKGKCFDCHFGVDFTGSDKFKNIGIYDGKKYNDEGRFAITKDKKDLGTFKTPGLRNIAQTAPYMHNGMLKSLSEVIDYYNEPDNVIPNSINRDTLLKKPLGLSKTEKKDLENFLMSLSDNRFVKR